MTRATRLPAPQRREVVTAALCWVVTIASVVLVSATAGIDPETSDQVGGLGSLTWWLTVVAVTGQAIALLRARSAPRASLLLVSGIPAAVALPPALVGTEVGDAFSVTSLALMVVSYVAFVERPFAVMRGPGLAAAALAFAGYVASGVHDDETSVSIVVAASLAQALFIVGGAALVAVLVTTRRDIRDAREHELRALEREQDALVREARAQERTAMARELHDIAAHHLSGIAVMAAAIERQISTDPTAATEGVRQVRSQSTAVLRDLRRLVGLLRESDAGELSVEALGGIAELTAQASALGAPVELVTLVGEGAASDAPLGAGLGPLAQLTAYRLVQESLANAVQHAPGAPCRVTVDDRDAEAVVVTVHNDAATTAPAPSRPGGGFGLVGMRERAELTAAELRYGPTIDGGWDVTLRLRRDTTGSDEHP